MTKISRTRRAPAVALGSSAMLTSAALMGLQIILALPSADNSPITRALASVAAALEFGVLTLVSWLLFTSIRKDPEKRKVKGLLFGAGIGLCVVAAALTVAALIRLSVGRGLGTSTTGFLAATSIVLVVSFAAQLLFLVVRFVAGRVHQHHQQRRNQRAETSPSMQEILGGRTTPFGTTTRVKTVPYTSTTPPTGPSRNASQCSKSPPPTSSAGSVAETISSVASSLTNVVRPITSKTRLLSSASHSLRSQRSTRRAPSLESLPRRTSGGDDALHQHGFDSWDTSSVDPQNRQTVLDHTDSPTTVAPPALSSPTLGNGVLGRSTNFLETIPASPTTSRSPSPGTPLDFEAPRLQRRSRSFSPARSAGHLPLPRPPQRAFTQHASASESHIHPLFRSDSPTPPKASPGTIV